MNLREMIQEVQKEGYSYGDATAKVCQDVVLKGIADSSLSRNVTIKGGVVMRSITGNVRRATQDMDIDFIKYSCLMNQLITLSVKSTVYLIFG